MTATDRITRARGTTFPVRFERSPARLPLAVALPLIAALSTLLWLALFHLAALLF